MTQPLSLERFPLHLGLGARAVPQPEFTRMDWYEGYGARNAAAIVKQLLAERV